MDIYFDLGGDSFVWDSAIRFISARRTGPDEEKRYAD